MTSTAKQRLVAAIGAVAASGVIAAVSSAEGRVHQVYLDPIGVATYCDGATRNPIKGHVYTDAECDAVLASDLYAHEQGMEKCLTVDRLSDGERIAYLSFTFNVGVGNFCSSTLLRKLNAGDHAGACAELSKWNKAGGQVWPGLTKRRAHERALCEGKS